MSDEEVSRPRKEQRQQKMKLVESIDEQENELSTKEATESDEEPMKKKPKITKFKKLTVNKMVVTVNEAFFFLLLLLFCVH